MPVYSEEENGTVSISISFDPDFGGPARISFDTLADWTTWPEEGIKHYSGSAVYHKTFHIDQKINRQQRMLLDLGTVCQLARVTLNGQALGTLWTAPWQIDITDAARKGENELEIEVVNLWVNRLIGDQHLPDERKYTFTTFNPYKTGSPLIPSGLLGPVKIMAYE